MIGTDGLTEMLYENRAARFEKPAGLDNRVGNSHHRQK